MNHTRNPLPKSDRSSQLQRKSIVSFQEILPVELFVFRDERVDDAGVDGSLELIINGEYTNLRTQVQLKSQQKKNARKDGVVTLPIETSNLNYILNGSEGLYVLYVEETQELFYAWGADENRRRLEMNSDWQEQKEVSIPLQELNESAVKDIYERIGKEASFRRKILESLAHAPSNDNLSVSIDPKNLETENSVEIEKFLNSVGMTLVATGYSNKVLEKLQLLTHKAATKSRFLLIKAYANYSTGRYQMALGLLSEVIFSNGLKSEDKRFAESLSLACRFNLGIITKDKYFQEAEAKSRDEEILYSEAKLRRLIDQFRSQMDRDEEILREIEKLKDKILTSDRSPESMKLSTRIQCLELVGFDLIRGLFTEIFKAQARRGNEHLVPLDVQFSDFTRDVLKFDDWNQESINLVSDAINIGHPIFLADAFLVKAFISLLELISKIAFIEFRGETVDPVSIRNDALIILAICEKAQKIYKQANMLETDIRIQLIMAQIYEIMNQTEAAKNLAQAVLSKSICLGYTRHENTANEIISGDTLFKKLIQKVNDIISQKQAGEYDCSLLETNEDVQSYANFMIETYKIQKNRKENVVKEVLCIRDINKEKRHWCQYIDVEQDLTHTHNPETLYAINPNRRIICSKFAHIVNKLTPDWIEQIRAFKNVYCSNCSDRKPKTDAVVEN